MEGEHAHSNRGVGADWDSWVDGLGRGSDVAGYNPGRCLASKYRVQADRYEPCAGAQSGDVGYAAKPIQFRHDLQASDARFSKPAWHECDADSELISEHELQPVQDGGLAATVDRRSEEQRDADQRTDPVHADGEVASRTGQRRLIGQRRTVKLHKPPCLRTHPRL